MKIATISSFVACLIYLACFIWSEAKILRISRPGHPDYFDTSRLGVDIRNCNKMQFQVRSCQSAKINIKDKLSIRFQKIIIGGWSNEKSAFRACSTCDMQLFPSYNLLDCNQFRRLWMEWTDEYLAFGIGSTVGADVILNLTRLEHYKTTVLTVSGYGGFPADFQFGEEMRSRYELVSEQGKFLNGLIRETSSSFPDCAEICHNEPDCGLFSYQTGHSLCALFSRITSTFTLEMAAGWKSWKMMYCYY